MLEFKNISFQYPEDETSMFENLSFHINAGDFVSIIGASGCGKSTLFRLINGLEKPDQGTVLINNTPVSKLKNYSAYMPQNDLLFPWRTIERNIALPMELQGISKQEQQEKIEGILDDMGLLAYKNNYPKELSGGMKQRASFARTLMTGCDILMLDEPFSALDSLTRISLQEWLLSQCIKLKKTVLFITHDVEEAIFLSNKILLIDERPIRFVHEIEVPLPKNRSRDGLKETEIIDLKESLISKLRQTVNV